MKTIKLLSLVLAVIMIFGSVAYADVINQPVADDKNATITVTGTIPGASYGDSLGIYVIKPGKSPADITEITGDKFKEVLAGYAPALTDNDGNYSVVIGLDGAGEGDYTILASSKKLTKDEALVYYYASKDAKLGFISELKSIVDASGSKASDVKTKLALTGADSANARLFGIGASDLILAVDQDGLAAVLYAMVKEDASILTPEYPSDFVEDLGIAALIQSLNDGTGDITDSRLSLDAKYANTFNGLGTTTKNTFVATYMKGKNLKSLKDVNEAFCNGVILAALNTAKSWKDYENIIVNHGDSLGIDMKDYAKLKKPSDVTDDLKDSYSDVEKFVKDVNDAIEELLEGKKESSGGGSGGGGGGGISVGGTLPTGNVPLDVFEPQKVSFSDVAEGHWASEAILALAESGAISGRGDDTFGPDLDVTREEFVKIAVVAMGITVDGTASSSYADVNSSAWYAPYVAAAEKEGIISGVGEGQFGIGRTITRQEAAAILYRIGTKMGKTFTPATLSFEDDASIADFAKEAVYALKGAGIINGVAAREFAPLANCSRAQSAKLIYGLVGKE